MHRSDPRELIERSPMAKVQIGAVAAAIGINAIDGFDVLAISFASPDIAVAWGLEPAALGVVLSMELVGMAIGSVLLGNAADRYGRRTTVLACLALMSASMALSSIAGNIIELSMCRVATGLGIGGMLPALTALIAEHSNRKSRSAAMSLMVVGYSAGGVIGGSLSALLLGGGDWRAIFVLGAVATGILLPIAFFAIPETVHFHIARPKENALVRVNRILSRFGLPAVDRLPSAERLEQVSPQALFRPESRSASLFAIVLYFGHILTFYFVMKWLVKMLVDAGHGAADAVWMMVLANLAGIAAGVVFGAVAHRTKLKQLSAYIFVGSTISVASLGLFLSESVWIVPIVIAIGFFINAGVVACYNIVARVFPASLRATGAGVVFGTGRFAAILAPVVAGQMLATGFTAAAVAAILALGSILALIALQRLPLLAE